MIIELIEAIFESKTWHWILLGGKGRNSQNPIRLEKIKKRDFITKELKMLRAISY